MRTVQQKANHVQEKANGGIKIQNNKTTNAVVSRLCEAQYNRRRQAISRLSNSEVNMNPILPLIPLL